MSTNCTLASTRGSHYLHYFLAGIVVGAENVDADADAPAICRPNILAVI